MSRTAYKFSALFASLLLTAALSGCGSDHREANANPGGVARVDEATCRVCHSTSIDPVSGRPILSDYLGTPAGPGGVPAAVKGSSHFENEAIAGCQGCHGGGAEHNGIGPIPFPDPLAANRCITCHTPNGVAPSAQDLTPIFTLAKTGFVNNCARCHTDSGVGGIHAARVTTLGCVGCHTIGQNGPQHGTSAIVNDNSGVRAIIPEFAKRSHHITSAAPTDAQCVVCHLEGTVDTDGVSIVVNTAKHMIDNKIHLRNADTDADLVWSGSEHTNIDNFCFSCHDSNGATSAGIAAVMTGKNFGGPFSPKNPFADTLTNSYDQTTRAGVIDVKTAFTTTNASHHAVSGQRYVYRFSTLANAQAWAARTGNPVPPASQIAEGHTDASPLGGTITGFGTGLTFDPAGPEEGGDATLYEAGKFVATYTPLGATQTVGDNSTLHCGDCHTVGQWKAFTAADGVNSTTNAAGALTTVAIGAHGSNNEYLLRNSLGTDEIHNNLTYVCFNCHQAGLQVASNALWAEKVADGLILPSTSVVNGTLLNTADGLPGVTIPVNYTGTPGPPTWRAGWNALHPVAFSGQLTGYATSHAVSAMHIQCIADSAGNTGVANRLSSSWEADKVRIYDFLPAPGATATAPIATGSTDPFTGGTDANSGNITGIGCTNCHNSGLRSGFGGIHGGNNTYTDGLGRIQTTYRFMPGMGNYRYAPPGGWDGKDVSDPTLLTINNPKAYGGPANGASTGYPGPSGKPIGGCYTNNTPTENAGFSACSHHGTSTAQVNGPVNGTITRGDGTVINTISMTNSAGVTKTMRSTYGGGTTSNTTTFEPTVREATAGGFLVTRPLKY